MEHETHQPHPLLPMKTTDNLDTEEKMQRVEELVKQENYLLKDALNFVNLNPGTYYSKRKRLRDKEGLSPRTYRKNPDTLPKPVNKSPGRPKAMPLKGQTTTTPPITTHRVDYHLHEQPKKEKGVVILMGDGEEIRKTMELAMLYKKEIG